MSIAEMLSTHPAPAASQDELRQCIDACFHCAQTCVSCADSCLAETNVAKLRRCIRTDQNCADVCFTTGRMLLRKTEWDREEVRAQLETCRLVCGVCAEECEQHRDQHEHCAICADACRDCEHACAAMLGSLE